jgi:hypothetical protein
VSGPGPGGRYCVGEEPLDGLTLGAPTDQLRHVLSPHRGPTRLRDGHRREHRRRDAPTAPGGDQRAGHSRFHRCEDTGPAASMA